MLAGLLFLSGLVRSSPCVSRGVTWNRSITATVLPCNLPFFCLFFPRHRRFGQNLRHAASHFPCPLSHHWELSEHHILPQPFVHIYTLIKAARYRRIWKMPSRGQHGGRTMPSARRPRLIASVTHRSLNLSGPRKSPSMERSHCWPVWNSTN